MSILVKNNVASAVIRPAATEQEATLTRIEYALVRAIGLFKSMQAGHTVASEWTSQVSEVVGLLDKSALDLFMLERAKP